MRRAEGERKRLELTLARMRSTLDALETTIRMKAGVTPQDAETISHAAADLAAVISRLWAYENAERDAGGKP
jgi:hypothetical protein